LALLGWLGQGPLLHVDSCLHLKEFVVGDVLALSDKLDVPRDPDLEVFDELLSLSVQAGHQRILILQPFRPVISLHNCGELLHILLVELTCVVLLVLEAFRVKLDVGEVLDRLAHVSDHSLEVTIDSVSGKHICEVLICILDVVDVGRCMLVVLPEQARYVDDLNECLNNHLLQFLTVQAIVKAESDELLVEARADPQ